MQLIAVAVIWTVIFGVAFAFFKIQNAVMKGGIRPPEEEELAGMDLPEMGVLAYPEFSGTGATLRGQDADRAGHRDLTARAGRRATAVDRGREARNPEGRDWRDPPIGIAPIS